MNNKSIGAKVSMMLPTVDSWGLIEPDQIVVVLPTDSTKWRKEREYCRYRGFFLSKERQIQYEKIDVPNSGFTISMFQDYDKEYYKYYAKSYVGIVLVKLDHPDLQKYPFTIATYIENRDFISIISKSQNIIDSAISGNFCCIHQSGISGINYTVFDIEDPEDTKMSKGKNLGKIISEGKGTTKWKVGHCYVTKTEKTFIYLGDISDGWFNSSYGSGFGNYLPHSFSCINGRNNNPVSLIIETTNLGKNESDLILENKEGWISVFLTTYLSYQINNSIPYYRNYLKIINKKTHPAIEMEGYFKDDSKNLKKIITEFYTSHFLSGFDYLPLVNREKLTEDKKTMFDKKLIEIIQRYVDNRRTRYYGSAGLDISIARDPEKFLAYLKSNRPSYRYYSSDIFGVLDYLGEDEFKKMISKCTF